MEIFKTIAEVRRVVAAARETGRTIGMVPTMGALHGGHASLIDAAVADGHFVVVTIFVNPTQFALGEDFDKYPRTPQVDIAECERHGASAVFMPAVTEMYPRRELTTITVSELTESLCGRRRSGHFAGVCTVVAKLLNIVGSDAAYFGQKDAQQAVVVRRMVTDLNFPTRLVVCPIVREADGLAMSSRNRYLSPAERAQAPQLYASLLLVAKEIARGLSLSGVAVQIIRRHLAENAPLGEVDYVEIVDPDTLQAVEIMDRPVLIALAVRFGRTRLIDNMLVDPPPARP
ncbi:MAG: pantoate--beta-alanine ligase [Planctomycetes bacterium]|nr:pantoate--beta-alanine ligase [Planctomycetota bacterium]